MSLLQQIRQLCCRHEDILRMEESRMWLECMSCGRTTRGLNGLGRPMRSNEVERVRPRPAWHARTLDRAA
jgi:hypothetical protein